MPPKSPTFPGPLTARGAVLAVLLSDHDQSGAEPLQGRTSLAAIIKSLKRKYHWPITAVSFPSNAADGQATWATVYRLPPPVVAKALREGGGEWLERRHAARDVGSRLSRTAGSDDGSD
jgi:hypothetical protein